MVHVHAPYYSIALGAYPLNKRNALPKCTPGAVTRVGIVPLVEFYPPGHPDLARRVAEETEQACNVIYLAKHGLISFAPDLGRACDIAEEFEQNARIYVITGGRVPLLSDDEISWLRQGRKKDDRSRCR